MGNPDGVLRGMGPWSIPCLLDDALVGLPPGPCVLLCLEWQFFLRSTAALGSSPSAAQAQARGVSRGGLPLAVDLEYRLPSESTYQVFCDRDLFRAGVTGHYWVKPGNTAGEEISSLGSSPSAAQAQAWRLSRGGLPLAVDLEYRLPETGVDVPGLLRSGPP